MKLEQRTQQDRQTWTLFVDDSGKAIQAEVYYSLGGHNHFTYKNEARGYYLMIKPTRIVRENGFTTQSFMAFSGIKTLIRPAARRGDKALREAVALVEPTIVKTLDILAAQGDSADYNAAITPYVIA